MIAIESAVRPGTVRLIIAVMLAGLWITLGSAGTPQSSSHPDAAGLFKERCEMCHAADGAGSALGKNMQVPDLRSDKVQRQPDSALSQAIREGKNNMPSFGSSLDGAQVSELVGFVQRSGSRHRPQPRSQQPLRHQSSEQL